MKVKLTREQTVRNPRLMGRDGRRVRQQLIAEHFAGNLSAAELRAKLSYRAPAGTVIEHPRAFRLVQLGVAVPVDKGAIAAADMTDAEITAAQFASELLEVGQAAPSSFPDADELNSSDEAAAAARAGRAVITAPSAAASTTPPRKSE